MLKGEPCASALKRNSAEITTTCKIKMCSVLYSPDTAKHFKVCPVVASCAFVSAYRTRHVHYSFSIQTLGVTLFTARF